VKLAAVIVMQLNPLIALHDQSMFERSTICCAIDKSGDSAAPAVNRAWHYSCSGQETVSLGTAARVSRVSRQVFG